MLALLLTLMSAVAFAEEVMTCPARAAVEHFLNQARTETSRMKYQAFADVRRQLLGCGADLAGLGTSTGELALLGQDVLSREIDVFLATPNTSAGELRQHAAMLRAAVATENLAGSPLAARLEAAVTQRQGALSAISRATAAEVTPLCATPTDLRPRLPAIRQQGALSWCYAFVASDLIYLASGLDVSPADIALNYMRASRERGDAPNYTDDSGGEIVGAIQATQGQLYCSAAEMDYTRVNHQRVTHSLNTLNNLSTLAPPAELPTTCQLWSTLTPLFSGLSYQETTAVLARAAGDDLVDELRRASCARPQTLTRTFVTETRIFPGDMEGGFERFTLEALQQGHAVGIELNLQPLGADVRHSMSVVGSQLNAATGECEFIVRNSWGTECANVPAGITCRDGYWFLPGSRLRDLDIETHRIRPTGQP